MPREIRISQLASYVFCYQRYKHLFASLSRAVCTASPCTFSFFGLFLPKKSHCGFEAFVYEIVFTNNTNLVASLPFYSRHGLTAQPWLRRVLFSGFTTPEW